MLAYNGERFIREAIESLLRQSFPDLTLFISDDASTDNTRVICEEYAKKDSRVTYHRQEKNIGVFPNYKFLLNQARGEYFMWASHDDLWEKDFIQTCLDLLIKDEDIGAASCNIAEIDSLDRTTREVKDFSKVSGKANALTVSRYVLQPEILGKCNIMYCLFRTSIIKKTWEIYPQREEWGSDYHFSLAVISHFGVKIDDRIMFKKRLGGMSNPNTTNNDSPDTVISTAVKNPKNHMFPFGRFRQYFRGHMEALSGTPYRPLVAILLLIRLPRSFLIYLKERNYKKFIKKTSLFRIYKTFLGKKNTWIPKISYSQCGEDIIMEFLFNWLKIRKPTYLDIGANDPVRLSNTYFFYKKGSRGVLVEPDPSLCAKLIVKRSGDVCLNVGVGFEDKEVLAAFYVMSTNTLNTFSKEEADRYVAYGNQKIEKIEKIKLAPIRNILKNNFEKTPNLVSLDTEGLDLKILQSWDWGTYRPEIFCIETLTYTEDNTESKIESVINFMKSKDYMIYADTYINTIFVDKKVWDSKKRKNNT